MSDLSDVLYDENGQPFFQGFTSESGGELRQHGEEMRQHLVFGLKVGYALSRGVQHSMREWPHEKEQCMKTFAFERWCDRLQLPTATRDFLLRLRSSPQCLRNVREPQNGCEHPV